MPRSQNRRTIEVPVPVYEDLKRRAEQEGTTIPAILQGLITDGQSMQEWFGQIDMQLSDLRREVGDLRQWLTTTTEDAK
ncbi:MAG TPA: hypothetical protein VLA19_08520 [Herpetosiphonaceae bacterium]|nr:hypothetical protein [Herpetosiphonaceae bacterium]